jgi:sporulation protein YlmC with PRC-barrel domain
VPFPCLAFSDTLFPHLAGVQGVVVNMLFEELKDKPVVSVAEGTELGKVHDLLLDGSYLQIAALVIGGGGLFGGHKQAIAYEAVRGIGPDAIMVRDREAVEEVRDDSAFAPLPGLGDLHQEIMSESGIRLGRVEDAEFDPQTGRLTQLRLVPVEGGKGQHDDAFAIGRDDIVSVSAKLAVVRHSVTEKRPPPEERNSV